MLTTPLTHRHVVAGLTPAGGVDVPQPAPDVVPLPPSGHPVPPPQEVPPEIIEPTLPGDHPPVGDPIVPGDAVQVF